MTLDWLCKRMDVFFQLDQNEFGTDDDNCVYLFIHVYTVKREEGNITFFHIGEVVWCKTPSKVT